MTRVLKKNNLIEPNEKIYIGKYFGDTPAHTHDFIELVYVVTGRAEHVVENGRTSIAQGDCFIIDLGVEHGYENVSPDFEIINCLFQPSFLSNATKDDEVFKTLAGNVFESFTGDDIPPFIYVEGGLSSGISGIIGQMLAEYDAKQTGYLEVLQSLLKVLLIYLFRGKDTTKRPKIVGDVLAYIKSSGGRKIKIEELSEAMFFSPAHISRLFKKYTGRNLSDFIRETRMEKVREKLVTSDASIDSILVEYGYQDKKSFYEQFFRAYGCTPKEYRIVNSIAPHKKSL